MLPNVVFAESSGKYHKRWYGGVGVGLSYLDPDASEIPFEVEERTDTAFEGFIGYDFHPRLAAELGFNDLGSAELSRDRSVDYQQASVSALFYGLTSKSWRKNRTGFSIFGRLGISRMDNTADVNFIRENDFSVLIGLGAELGLTNNLALRGSLTSFDFDANYAGLALLYRFGHGSHDAAVATRVEPSEPVVVPEPIVEPEPEPIPDPEPEYDFARLVKEFWVLFDTNGTILDADARKIIEDAKDFLNTNDDYRLVIVGYTDITGPRDKNQLLSKERSNTVRHTLLAAGVNPDRLSVRSVGETKEFGATTTVRGQHENRRTQITVLIDESGEVETEIGMEVPDDAGDEVDLTGDNER